MYKINNKTINLVLQDDPINEMTQPYREAIDKELSKPLDEIDCNQIEKCVDCIIQIHETV